MHSISLGLQEAAAKEKAAQNGVPVRGIYSYDLYSHGRKSVRTLATQTDKRTCAHTQVQQKKKTRNVSNVAMGDNLYWGGKHMFQTTNQALLSPLEPTAAALPVQAQLLPNRAIDRTRGSSKIVAVAP